MKNNHNHRQREQGQKQRGQGTPMDIVGEVERLLHNFPTQRGWIEKTIIDLKCDFMNHYDAYIAGVNNETMPQRKRY